MNDPVILSDARDLLVWASSLQVLPTPSFNPSNPLQSVQSFFINRYGLLGASDRVDEESLADGRSGKP